MRRWAAANPCAESERLLAKLCIQIAVNRMLRWVHCCRQRGLAGGSARAQGQQRAGQEGGACCWARRLPAGVSALPIQSQSAC